MKAAVIGSGIGGLACAVRIAAQGHSVTVYEKNLSPGGKVSELRAGKFRFDTGPSLFTLPELAEELFVLYGENMRDYLPYEKLDINCRYFFPDGSRFDFFTDPEKLDDEIRRATLEKPETVFRRLRKVREAYETGAPVFLFTDFHRLSNYNTPPYRKAARNLGKLDFLRTMHAANRKDFTDERFVRIFDRYATYNGSDPYRAPATLNMIAHLENNIGAYFPRRGMYDIAEQLFRLAVRHGVGFCFGSRVEKVLVEHGRAVGIQADGIRENYDIVVSDSDARHAAEQLVPDHPLRRRIKRREPSSSALIFYWAVNRTHPQLEVHNILFGNDYREEFRSLFRGHNLSDDPTVYIFVSSKMVPGDAPAGAENWFVMVNAPADTGQDWQRTVEAARKSILRKIARSLGTDLVKHIVGETTATPRTIARNTLSYGGSLYGPASNSALAAFLRHPNSLRSIEGLYFVGGSVHPGGGIPLCMAGAKIAADKIQERYGRK